MWRNRFGRGVGPVVRQNTEWMNECLCVCMYVCIIFYLMYSFCTLHYYTTILHTTLFPHTISISLHNSIQYYFPISKAAELATCCYCSVNLSNDILFVNFWKVLLNFAISLFYSQPFSDRNTAAFKLSLSCSSSLQLNDISSSYYQQAKLNGVTCQVTYSTNISVKNIFMCHKRRSTSVEMTENSRNKEFFYINQTNLLSQLRSARCVIISVNSYSRLDILDGWMDANKLRSLQLFMTVH
jgi:hypothetical protein